MRSLLLAVVCIAAFSALPSAQQVENISKARQILTSAKPLIKDIPETQQEGAAANLAGQMARAGDLLDALETVHQLKPERQGLPMGCVGWQLANGGHSEQALSLIQKTAQSQGRDVGFEQLAQVLAKNGDVEQALNAAHLIAEPNRFVETLVRVAVQQGKSGDLPGASRTLHEALEAAEQAAMRDLNNAGLFGQIAGAQSEIGNVPEVQLALTLLSDLADRQKKQTGETFLMRELAMAEALRGDTSEAMGLISQLPASAANPLYMVLSETLARNGAMAEALAVLQKISESGTRDGALREIAMLRRNQDLGDSFEAIDRMRDPSNRNEALATLALELAEDSDPAAYQSLQRWNDSGGDRLPNFEQSASIVAVTYGLLGDFVSAERILYALRDPEKRLWPLWNLTHFLVNQGHMQEALELANWEENPLPKIYALLGTATGLLDQSEAETKAAHHKQQP